MAVNILDHKESTDRWRPILLEYDPLKAGSIDGTDTVPHDRAIWRAMNATYKPPKYLPSDPTCTIFVGRLNRTTVESDLQDHFKKYGDINSVHLVRDIVTGFSKCYGFIEFAERRDARDAQRACGSILDGKQIMVEFECGRKMQGWIPRRLGGGFCGKKESGQLRFGGNKKPFKRPYSMIQEDRKRLQNELGVYTPHNYQSRDRRPYRPEDRNTFHSSNRGNPRRDFNQRYNADRRPQSGRSESDSSNRLYNYRRNESGSSSRKSQFDSVRGDVVSSNSSRVRVDDKDKPEEFIMLYNNLRSREDLRKQPVPAPPEKTNPRDREQSFRSGKEKPDSEVKRDKLTKVEKAMKEHDKKTSSTSKHPDWEFYELGKW